MLDFGSNRWKTRNRKGVRMTAGRMAKRGCWLTVALVLLIAGAGLLWPYRAERIEGAVSGNRTGCAVSVNGDWGWNEEAIAPGITALHVAYPLKMAAFVGDCSGAPGGRPHSAELISIGTGQVIARGFSCADRPEGYLCQLEIPPIAALQGQDRYRVSVVRRAGQAPLTADIHLSLKREWRSVVWDALMSV